MPSKQGDNLQLKKQKPPTLITDKGWTRALNFRDSSMLNIHKMLSEQTQDVEPRILTFNNLVARSRNSMEHIYICVREISEISAIVWGLIHNIIYFWG